MTQPNSPRSGDAAPRPSLGLGASGWSPVGPTGPSTPPPMPDPPPPPPPPRPAALLAVVALQRMSAREWTTLLGLALSDHRPGWHPEG